MSISFRTFYQGDKSKEGKHRACSAHWSAYDILVQNLLQKYSVKAQVAHYRIKLRDFVNMAMNWRASRKVESFMTKQEATAFSKTSRSLDWTSLLYARPTHGENGPLKYALECARISVLRPSQLSPSFPTPNCDTPQHCTSHTCHLSKHMKTTRFHGNGVRQTQKTSSPVLLNIIYRWLVHGLRLRT